MRLYDGCPDDELAAKWAAEDNDTDSLAAVGGKCTWFPVEGRYQCCVPSMGYRSFGEFSTHRSHAIQTAILAIKKLLG